MAHAKKFTKMVSMTPVWTRIVSSTVLLHRPSQWLTPRTVRIISYVVTVIFCLGGVQMVNGSTSTYKCVRGNLTSTINANLPAMTTSTRISSWWRHLHKRQQIWPPRNTELFQPQSHLIPLLILKHLKKKLLTDQMQFPLARSRQNWLRHHQEVKKYQLQILQVRRQISNVHFTT